MAWAAAIFPLGVWLGVVAWRTGSVLLTFAMHAGVNGLWTAGMMILHRDPASEPKRDITAAPWASSSNSRRAIRPYSA